MTVYYNTTHEGPEDLRRSKEAAQRQEDIILDLFESWPHRTFTPFEVHSFIPMFQGVPITSVRRAITNLTTAGKIEKTDQKRDERYGKGNYCWRLAPRREKIQGELFGGGRQCSTASSVLARSTAA